MHPLYFWRLNVRDLIEVHLDADLLKFKLIEEGMDLLLLVRLLTRRLDYSHAVFDILLELILIVIVHLSTI